MGKAIENLDYTFSSFTRCPVVELHAFIIGPQLPQNRIPRVQYHLLAPAPDFSSIRAVLFDIDDTLFPSSEFSRLARRNAIRAMIQAGLHATPTNAERTLARIVSNKGSNFGGHFDLLARKFPSSNRDRVVAAGVAAYHNTKSSISPYPDTARLLLSLRERGYLLAAASEGVSLKQWDKLIRLGLDPFFHHVFVTSNNEGGKTPSDGGKTPAFYKKIARALNLAPNQILMVGDNPAKDIASASAAGMLTVRVLTGKHAREPARADITLRSLALLGKRLAKRAAK